MFRKLFLLSLVPPAFLMAGLPAYGPLLDATHSAWPDKNHLAVVCDYGYSRKEVDALATAAAKGSLITVLDVHSFDALGRAATLLKLQRPDYLVVLDKDPLVRPGSVGATYFLGHLNGFRLPSVATSSAALKQGALLALGADTGYEPQVNNGLKGTVFAEGYPMPLVMKSRASLGGAHVEVLTVR